MSDVAQHADSGDEVADAQSSVPSPVGIGFGVVLLARLTAALGSLSRLPRKVSVDTGPATVVVGSAEGVTTFGGLKADPNQQRTREWLDKEFETIGEQHKTANRSLKLMRERDSGAASDPGNAASSGVAASLATEATKALRPLS
jgi:hypothetical protein